MKANNPLNLFRRYKLFFLIGLVTVAIATYFLYQHFLKPTSLPETTTLTRQNLRQTLDVAGKINAGSQATLRFQTGGKLAWVGVKTGDKVEQWQSIASLDKTILQKKLEQELNNFLTNRWDFEQYRDDNNVVSDDFINHPFLTPELIRELEKDQFSLRNATLTVEIQKATNNLATIYTPIDGIVVQMSQELPGVNVTTTDTFTIVDPNTLYFEAEIDETDISQIKLNQSSDIILDAYLDTIIPSQISHIDFQSSAGQNGGTVYKIRLPLPPGLIEYRLGLNGDVNILLQQKENVMTLPIDVIIQREEATYVEILKATGIEERVVEIGLETDDYVEILSGVAPNEQVIFPE